MGWRSWRHQRAFLCNLARAATVTARAAELFANCHGVDFSLQARHIPHPYAHWAVFGVVDREDEPAITSGPCRRPGRTIRDATGEPCGLQLIRRVILEISLTDFQAPVGEPSVWNELVISGGPGWVCPAASFVTFHWQRLDQNDFFRHDFVLAAIAARFEGKCANSGLYRVVAGFGRMNQLFRQSHGRRLTRFREAKK